MESDEVHRTRVASSHLDRTTEFGQEPDLVSKKEFIMRPILIFLACVKKIDQATGSEWADP